MLIKIKFHPTSLKEEIKKLGEGEYEIWSKEKPINNKANIKLIKLLKKYFKREVKIKSGFNSRNKIIEVIKMERFKYTQVYYNILWKQQLKYHKM